MKVADLITFRSDLFFDGAVQLSWTDNQIDRAKEAARSFVFHGPRYHGVSRDPHGDDLYRLTDTATLTADLLTRISSVAPTDTNPFSLAIAGYGSGKSHFALALTRLLRDPSSDLSNEIVANLSLADPHAAVEVRGALDALGKPALVIALDGTGNFNLGNALSASLFRVLKECKIDDRAIRELSPRFDDAVSFVKRNYELRSREFDSRLSGKSQRKIVELLSSRDEDTYALVDELYLEANGAHIPVSGRESIQDVIGVFCDTYCSKDGPFSRLVIVFDEFGRFLEYVAERPALAGDSALQQMFQGIQDNASRAHFLGFIQYELKAYLARLGNRDAMHIQKYITRFDVAKKYHVSSNLETIIAHLLDKKDETALEKLLDQKRQSNQSLHTLMADMLPGLRQLPVWNDPQEFERVIVRGCWPLHPLATWFLTRQQDIVQSRSAITFVKKSVDEILQRDAVEHNSPVAIAASHIVAGDMLTEMLAAERAHGGTNVENLIAAVEKYDAQLEPLDRALLNSITAAKKMRVVSSEQNVFNHLLSEFVGRPLEECSKRLDRLEQELGVIAWSRELKQYEIVTDAATRGQYQKDLRSKLANISSNDVEDIFIGRAKAWTDMLFEDVLTTFGQERDIPTLEWLFAAQLTNEQRLMGAVRNAFSDWRQAVKPDQAKGQVLYCLVAANTDIVTLKSKLEKTYEAELLQAGAASAPVWTILMVDRSEQIRKYLATLYVLDDRFDKSEQERYARFIPEERSTAKEGLQRALRDAIKERISVVAGVEVPAGRIAVESTAIFKLVYPQAIPFPFDGLNTRNGNGNADASVISRALFGREVSSAWLAVQQVKLQNRVRAVLGTSWEILSKDGSVKLLPGNSQIANLLTTMETAHKATLDRTLGDDLAFLTRPPIGCSLASASLLIALLVGRSQPPRAIRYEKEGIALKEWLEAAYGTTGKFLSETVLSKTSVLFLTEDALTRWSLFFAAWDAETTFKGNVDRLRESERLRSHDPMPEQLEANFRFLQHKALEDQDQLNSHIQVLQELEQRLERAIQQRNVQEFLAIADGYLTRRKLLNSHPEKWTVEQVATLLADCSQVTDLVRETAPRWIDAQACNSSEQIGDFRTRMSRAQRTLEGLGIHDLARSASKHSADMISRVRERYQYETSLNDAMNLIRTSDPLASSPLREVNDRIEKAELLIGILNAAISNLNKSADVSQLVDQLRTKQHTWRQFRSERQRQYSSLFALSPNTTQDARDVLYKLNLLGQQFLNTKDAVDIQRRVASCTALANLLSEFDHVSGSPDNIESVLKKAYERTGDRLTVFETEGDDEGDAERDWMRNCVFEYIATRKLLLEQRSSVWTAAAIEELKALSSKVEQLIHEGIPKKFLSLPESLSEADRSWISRQIKALDEIRTQSLEDSQARRFSEWLDDLESQIHSLDTLSESACTEILIAIKNRTSYASSANMERILNLEKSVQRRLDELDISDLVERIRSMPTTKRAALFEELRRIDQQVA